MSRHGSRRSERVQSDKTAFAVETAPSPPSPEASAVPATRGLHWTWKVVMIVWASSFVALTLYEWFRTLFRMLNFYRPSVLERLPGNPVYTVVVAAALSLLLLVVVPLLAARKGYAWYLWTFSASVVGLLVLALLPAVDEVGATEEVSQARRKLGNRLGAGLSVLTLIGIVVQVALLF